MKTIIKIPVYVELTTPEQDDRKEVTNGVRSILQPALIRIIKEFFPGYIYESEKKELKRYLNNNFRFRIVTESEVLKVGVEKPSTEKKPWDLV